MAKYVDVKVLKKKKLGEELTLKVSKNEMSGRIFVEFATNDGKMVLQKSFQATYDGEKESEKFSKSIKSLSDLKKYFGINQ